MAIANKQEAQAFLSKLTVESDGLPPGNISEAVLADVMAAHVLVGKSFDFMSFLAKAKATAVAAAKPAPGKITAKVGKRGGISVYGLQRNPVTLYVGQWNRFLDYLGAPADSEMRKFIASNPTSVLSASADFKQGDDPAYLADIRAGKVPHATIEGDVVTVTLAQKSE